MKTWKTFLAVLLLGLLPLSACWAQMIYKDPNQPDRELSAATRSQIIESVLQALHEQYVYPEKAIGMEAAVRRRMKNKEYDQLSSAKAFADSLTAHLRAVSQDKHLSLDFVYQTLPPKLGPDIKIPEEVLQEMRKRAARSNFGFSKMEILDGNIGYLKLDGFASPAEAAETAAAAMNFLANTDALILDLRTNRGGSLEGVDYLSSYFFSPELPVHLNDVYDRVENSTRQFWSYQALAGKHYLNKPLYVLTSSSTFSAGEGFAYSLQAQGKAKVIGEVSGGGAHPSRAHRVTDHFLLIIPFAKSVNPVTQSNWEGTGVIPDLKTPASQALEVAHKTALAALAKDQHQPQGPNVVQEVPYKDHPIQKSLPKKAAPDPKQ